MTSYHNKNNNVTFLFFFHSEFGEGRQANCPSGNDSMSSRFDVGPSPSAVGGLSVTGCLADFSVYIFHPYGGGKKPGNQMYYYLNN